MADKKILSQAIASLVEGNEAEAKKAFSMFINEAKVEIIAEKLTEKEETEEVIPTDDEVATLKDEIKVEEPAEEIDLDDAPVEEPSEELPAEEVPAEETTEVVPVETAEEALADSGEEVGIEEDPDFLALVDEFNKSLETDAVEVPAEEVAEPVEELPAEEVPADDELVDLDAEPVAEEEPVAEPVEEPAEEKQEEIDIEKFVK